MVTGWNTCPVRTEHAGLPQPAEETALGTKIAACCYLQGCYQENRPRLFSEVQSKRKKELKKINVKSC